jgi:hypothetical protein
VIAVLPRAVGLKVTDSNFGLAVYRIAGLGIKSRHVTGGTLCFAVALSAGRAIGTNGWRQTLAREHAQTRLAPEWAADELNSCRRDGGNVNLRRGWRRRATRSPMPRARRISSPGRWISPCVCADWPEPHIDGPPPLTTSDRPGPSVSLARIPPVGAKFKPGELDDVSALFSFGGTSF